MSVQSRPGTRGRSAQSRVEEYLRAESRLSTITKPEQESDETKGQYCWRLVRNCVRHAVDLMKKSDWKDIIITHGMEHIRKLNHEQKVQGMVHNKNTQVQWFSTKCIFTHLYDKFKKIMKRQDNLSLS